MFAKRPVTHGRPRMPNLNLRKTCTHSLNRGSLKMVLECTLADLADHALCMHRLAPSEGHFLGLTGRFRHTAMYCFLSMLSTDIDQIGTGSGTMERLRILKDGCKH